MRGRKPHPDNIVRLRGNPSQHRRKPSVKVQVTLPKCPSHLSGVAREEWKRLAPKLFEAGLLTELDTTALAGLCEAQAMLLEARRKIAEEGMTVPGPGGVLRTSPWVRIANQALQQVRLFAGEFGMTPVARQRVKVVPPAPADDFEDLLNT
jgi:P27 family predicted phage terminase small subunit